MAGHQVHLAVYDLSRGMAAAMSQQILGTRIDGIWHTGVVVYGMEYFYGGGIQCQPQGTFPASNNMQPTQYQDMGVTTKTKIELQAYLRTINHRFTQATYDLINNNCNNFSECVVQFLTGGSIPDSIVNLPRIVFNTPGGAMLRPMVESMQNEMRRQQGTGMDPFGGASTQTQSINASMPAANIPSSDAPPVRANIEERALVSGDCTTVHLIAKKIFALKSMPPGECESSTTVPALSDTEVSLLMDTVHKLGADVPTKEKRFTVEAYALLERILLHHSTAQMSALFVLRLMTLHDVDACYKSISVIPAVVKLLLSAQSEGGLASIPAHVMAICSLSNLISHEYGIRAIGADEYNIANDIVDISMGGLSHPRAEVRQTSATLAYNFTLIGTYNNELSGAWKVSTVALGEASSAELHPQALQLLCGALEGVLQETDAATRHRRLAIACRILRVFKRSAAELVQDLGFTDALSILKSDSDIVPQLATVETAILSELVTYFP